MNIVCASPAHESQETHENKWFVVRYIIGCPKNLLNLKFDGWLGSYRAERISSIISILLYSAGSFVRKNLSCDINTAGFWE